MDFPAALDSTSETPLYRQLYEQIASRIRSGKMARGERLPATRELAGLLGLNRTTVSAAYEMLESEGLIAGHVGRGSFVTSGPAPLAPGLNWTRLLESHPTTMPAGPAAGVLSFATSRPAGDLFPLDDFRASCAAVLRRPELADILQLGSPGGYEPLRRYLLERARRSGVAGPGDDLMVTSGCQQALDLIGRVLVRPGDPVLVEDPVYPGLKSLFAEMGAQLIGVPVGERGIDVGHFERILQRERPRLAVVTSNFQNPTGNTLPRAERQALLDVVGRAGIPLIENDAYGDLRYAGEELPPLKRLDASGNTILLRSFSKISFPGLRVGWVVGPRSLLDRLRQAKQVADLHTDQLSQAVLLEFAESGQLELHRARMLRAGAERLQATLAACDRHLPPGTQVSRPQGGMNVWVRLPAPLDAGEMLAAAQSQGVAYLPGRYFAVSRFEAGALRLSFAGLTPAEIERGLAVLGRVFGAGLERASGSFEPAPAMV
jgi:2-aminoadipate transaminase